MKIINYIIQAKETSKEVALQNLQRQAIFLTDSHYAHKAMSPFRDERPVTVEYAITMKQETEKLWSNWHKNECPIEVKLVSEPKIPNIYKELKSMWIDTKTEEQPLGMYWLVNMKDAVPSAGTSRIRDKGDQIHTMSLFVDVENCPELEEYLNTL